MAALLNSPTQYVERLWFNWFGRALTAFGVGDVGDRISRLFTCIGEDRASVRDRPDGMKWLIVDGSADRGVVFADEQLDELLSLFITVLEDDDDSVWSVGKHKYS